MSSSKPPTTPSSSLRSAITTKNLMKQPQPLTETPIRTIQDHGTVGAVANNGSDLSYDLSSADSSFQIHNNIQQDDGVDDGVEGGCGGGGDDDDHNYNDKNIVDQKAASGGNNMNVNIIVSPLPLPREVVVKDKENDNDDDNLSLDDEKVFAFKGEYGVRNRKLDYSNKHNRDSDHDHDHDDIAKNGIVIQDLHQLRLDKSNSSVHDHEDDHNDYEKEEEGGKGGGGTKNGTGLDLENVAQWIKSGKCSKILVLCGAGVSCSAGIPDFRTPGSGL